MFASLTALMLYLRAKTSASFASKSSTSAIDVKGTSNSYVSNVFSVANGIPNVLIPKCVVSSTNYLPIHRLLT